MGVPFSPDRAEAIRHIKMAIHYLSQSPAALWIASAHLSEAERFIAGESVELMKELRNARHVVGSDDAASLVVSVLQRLGEN